MAARFWIGGTGTWDAVTTTHWSATTGPGTPGATVPGAADTVTFDANSGGGVVTVNTTVNVISITSGAFTGTLDFSANNNNVTLQTFNNSGTGVRTFNMGNGTWTITGTGTCWTQAITTSLTFNANLSVLTFTATSGTTRTFSPGAGLTYATVSIGGNTGGGTLQTSVAFTIGTLNITAPNSFSSSGTVTVTNALNLNGISLSSMIYLSSVTVGTVNTISSANNGAFTYCAFRDITFAGGGTFTATNSLDLGHNSGITITAPSAGRAPAPIVIARGTPY